jgi:hypothetical protein
VLVALVAAVAFSYGFTPVRASNDVWWHLKSGEYLSEIGLPTIEPFNHVAEAEGIIWHNHEWIAQWAMWQVYRAGDALTGGDGGGLLAVILAKAVLLAATYVALALFAGRVSGSLLAGVLAAIVAAEIGRRTFYPRPPVISYAMLVALYAALHAVRVGRLCPWRASAAAFFFFAAWANLHGGWAAGLVMIASFGAGGGLEAAGKLWRRAPIATYFGRVVRGGYPWLAIMIAALLGTLVNPSGIHLYDMFSTVLKDEFLLRSIAELQPPPVELSSVFFATLVLLPVLAMAVPRRFPYVAELLFVPFFAWQAIHHWRHLTLFGLLAAPLLAWLIADAIRGLPKGVAGLARVALVVTTIVVTINWVAIRSEGGTYLQRNAQLVRGVTFHAEAFPAAEAEFLINCRLPGRLFNLDYYAGYLIWALAPEPYQVYSDSRFDIFGSFISREAAAIMAGADGWRERLAERGVNLLLLPTEPGRGSLVAILAEDPEWACVYYRVRGERTEDGRIRVDPASGWVIFARADASSAERLSDAKMAFERMRPSWMPDDLFGYEAPPRGDASWLNSL